MVGVDRLPQRRQEPVHSPTREGRQPQHRRVAEEAEPVGDVRGDGLPTLGRQQIPLVQDDDDRVAGRVDPLGEPLVLVRHAVGGVDDEQRHVAAVDRRERADERVVLGAVVDPGLAAQPGRVDEPDPAFGGVDDRVDGVTGRPRHVVNDDPLGPDQPVEKRRLADVRAPDDRHRGDDGGLPGAGVDVRNFLPLVSESGDRFPDGEPRHDDVEEVPDTASVEGRNGHRVPQSEAREFPGVLLACGGVHLVRDDEHGRTGASQYLGDGVVFGGDPGRHVDDEEHDVGLGDRRAGLVGNEQIEPVTPRHDAAGVDDAERPPRPCRLQLEAVASHPRSLLDDGGTPPDDPVDERRLTDVRAPGDDDRGHAVRRQWLPGSRPVA